MSQVRCLPSKVHLTAGGGPRTDGQTINPFRALVPAGTYENKCISSLLEWWGQGKRKIGRDGGWRMDGGRMKEGRGRLEDAGGRKGGGRGRNVYFTTYF